MVILLKNRWAARLHFGLLLLIFGELIAWQNASQHNALDWLALAAIYAALGSLCLDMMVRFKAHDVKSVLLVAGIYALLRATALSVIQVDSLDKFAIDLIFLPMGVQVLMFLLALASFQLLATGEATGLYAFVLAGLVGFSWGIWTRWSPELESVNISAPVWDESLPYVIIALVVGGIFPMLMQSDMDMDDWLLTPYESAFAGGIVLVTMILRGNAGYIDTLGAGVIALVLLMLAFMLYFTQTMRHALPFQHMTPPHTPHIIGWLLILMPFALLAWLGYNLSDATEAPFQATLLFRGLLLFGIAWLPVVSIWLGASIVTQMTREGY